MSKDTNLALWETVERTDPKHVKSITGKPYSGTSPKPYFLIHEATKVFGPCGIGWGFEIISERIEDGGESERLHIARVRVWYKWNEQLGTIEHVGGTPFSGKRSSGKSYVDEDAPKKSVTDALVKALSMIGFAGDIFMGRYDDSKYVNNLRDEFAEPKEPEPTPLRQYELAEKMLRAAANLGTTKLRVAYSALQPEIKESMKTLASTELKAIAEEADARLKAPVMAAG